jgi:2-oxoglutarate ferredoxin oxidoreductase subunit alpha
MVTEINFMIGGEAGQGIQTMGFILAKTLSREGLGVFADQDYESRVRGGHSFYRVRASDRELLALSEQVDILVAVDQNTVNKHQSEVKAGGLAIFDSDKLKIDNRKLNAFGIPLENLAQKITSNKVMANSVAIGAAIAVAGYRFEGLSRVLAEEFSHRGKEEVDSNIKAAQAGYDHVLNNKPEFVKQPIKPSRLNHRILLNGNEAIAFGAMVAGCKFVAAYPMTPTTSILEYISARADKYNIVAIQPEDEIAAINMAVGAGYTGVRAMTATSGDGFALMTEGFGLAGITETPVVIVLGQRVGPAVGMPTRTEQGELKFAVYGGSGDFPRAVLAPHSIEDAFYTTVKAFNLADKYQIPVVILTDHHLASSYQTINKLDLRKVKIDRGELIDEAGAKNLTDYNRHKFTESGISPRVLPLPGGPLVVTDSDEHDEAGHMIEDAETRTKMMIKRMKKVEGLKNEVASPRYHSKPNANITLIGWGSTYGSIIEAASILERDRISVNLLQLNELWPFPVSAVTSAMQAAKKSVVIENNATGQLAGLITAETGEKPSRKILKFDGRPFSPAYIADKIKEEVA